MKKVDDQERCEEKEGKIALIQKMDICEAEEKWKSCSKGEKNEQSGKEIKIA